MPESNGAERSGPSRFASIAIVGRACVVPGALSPEALWEAVVSGTDLLSQVPKGRWGMSPEDALCEPDGDSRDRSWSDRGGYVRGFETVFDPTGFAIPADEIVALDPVFQWTLHTARAALSDAGQAASPAGRFGAVFGNLSFPSAGMAAFTQSVTLGLDNGSDIAGARNRFTSGLPALLLERALGLGVGAVAVDAACASSLYAIKLACDRLHDGTADLMLAGAVNCADDLFIHLGFTALHALSRSGRSRPFHRDADGLVPAEGCAFVALRRLDDAVRDGNVIHAIIRGIGLSNDGRGQGMLVPSEKGQIRAIAQAFDNAGLEPNDISLLECHATGTQVGDATEVRSAASIFAGCTDVPIGSLKSNTGHLITAAGVAGLIKVIEAMRHEVRPPSLHADDPLDALAGTPFRVLRAAESWDRSTTSDGVLRAGVSAFGFGGNNAHLIVEEPASAASLVARSAPAATPLTPLAIVGIGIAAASAVGRHAFAEALFNNTPCLDATGEGRMPDIVLRLAAQKFPPKDLDAALRQQLAILQVAAEALDEFGPVNGATTGVYIGMGTDPQAARFGVRWRTPYQVAPLLNAAGVLGTMPNLVANRLNSQYDIAGPSFTVSSEEHSGIDALTIAARALRDGTIDTAMVGAVDLSCDPVHRAASELVLPRDRKRPGDAAVMLILKRLDQAERDGDRVYAVMCDDANVSPDVRFGLGDGATSVTHLFGHAHAASGLVHVAAAVVALHHRVTIGDVPLVASNPASGPGLPDGVGPRTVIVETNAIDGIVQRSVLLGEATTHRAPSRIDAPRLHVWSGASTADVLADVAANRESDGGPVRLVVVASHPRQLADRRAKALRHIEFGHPAGRGVHFRTAPVVGEMAFVFAGGGAAYNGMGVQLLRAMPELVDAVSARCALGDVAGWIFDADHAPSASDYLWGTSLLSQAHARLTLDVLKLRPEAAIGYSSGETNSLFAFGVWRDMEAMRNEINATSMMDRELAGEFVAVARAWGVERAEWAVWSVLAPVTDVRTAIETEAHVHLMLINTPRDVVICGDPTACDRVVDALGRQRCRPVGYNLACHVPEVRDAFHEQWLDVHTRAVSPVDGVRFYSNGPNGAYEIGSAACAEVITRQAETTVDFPATIETAYADGVRIFVEHGPVGACSNFVREILDGRDILAVHLDRRSDDIEQVFDAVAALVAAGVNVDYTALTERLNQHESAAPAYEGATLSFSSHPALLVSVPHAREATAVIQVMEPAPALPSVFERYAPRFVAYVGTPTHDAVAVLQEHLARLHAAHEHFIQQQSTMHEQFLATRGNAFEQFSHVPRLESRSSVLWDKAQLEIHSSGRISELFGTKFAAQDQYAFQCRMPEPPLLLADRVTGLQAEPGVLGVGTIWTETDIAEDSWYLNDGYMPAGFMIESGQADLMLISYMGIDLLNKGERVYRLLGCTLTYHGNLPSAGDTLQYEIRITGHAQHGATRLFFFEYDCTVNAQPRLTVRCAGRVLQPSGTRRRPWHPLDARDRSRRT
jgi:acyl transferase domain-containing protein